MAQADMNHQHLLMASQRVPPSWGPSDERVYPFRRYAEDVLLWCTCTDVDAARQGPCIALRLTGEAKTLALALGVNVLAAGHAIQDPNQAMGVMMLETGVAYLMRTLEHQYAPLQQEEQLWSISQLMGFRRKQAESTDEAVARFELVRHHAQAAGQIVLPTVVTAWLLLSALGIARERWPMLLAATQGALPDVPAEYQAMVAYIRRAGHLTDRNIDPVKSLNYATFDEADGAPDGQYSEHSGSGDGYYPGFQGSEASGDEASSCDSQEFDMDYSDLSGMDDAMIGENLYLSYAFAKQRWRTFQHKSKGGRKGKGKRRKGGGKGSGKRSKGNLFKGKGTFLEYLEQETPETEDTTYSYKGGSSKGRGPKGNPLGMDGKQMTCRNCGSTQHFAHKCDKAKSGSSSSGTSTFLTELANDQAQYEAASDDQSNSSSAARWQTGAQKRSSFFQNQQPGFSWESNNSYLVFADGRTEQLSPVVEETDLGNSNELQSWSRRKPLPKPSPAPNMFDIIPHKKKETRQVSFGYGLVNYAWFQPDMVNQLAFHSNVRLKRAGEALLVDCGAIGNLAGDAWAKRCAKWAESKGCGSKLSKLPEPITIGGVGKNEQRAVDQMEIPIALAGNHRSVFSTPLVPDSELPALRGLEVMTAHGMLIDVRNMRLIMPGKGGYKMELSPGSVSLAMERAQSGHLLLPCTEWQQITSKAPMIMLSPQ